ncbi:MAG: hypothetical protein AAF602_30140 [Myxococcota bacterium]
MRAWAEHVRARRPALLGASPGRVVLTLTEAPPPLAVFPFRKDPVAVVAADGHDDGPGALLEALEGLGAVSAYTVERAYPVVYEQRWDDGTPTPSPMLLTLLRRRRGLSDEAYLRRWHGGHTPLSLRIHPLWHYERNAIVAPLTDDTAPCDGIVAEACPTRADLLDPRRFYGGTLAMIPNMVRVGLDVLGFLDLRLTEVFLTTEWVLRRGR